MIGAWVLFILIRLSAKDGRGPLGVDCSTQLSATHSILILIKLSAKANPRGLPGWTRMLTRPICIILAYSLTYSCTLKVVSLSEAK
jgi:hypothetical protein